VKPPLLIVNPACGAQSARTLPQVLAAVEKTMGDVVIRHTARRGHASELAEEGAREGYELIVAVGGDGTLSEVVNGVLTACDAGEAVSGAAPAAEAPEDHSPHGPPFDVPQVGLINVGTGGDFRKSLGIGAGYERSLEALALGRVRLVDVCRATFTGTDGQPVTRYVVNVVSAGLGGRVDHYIDVIPRFVGGTLGYYMASLWAVAAGSEQPVRARVTWNGETRDEVIPAYLVAICNGRWFGGGMDVAPMALPDDGRLEVVTITERNRLRLLAKTRTIYSGRHLDEPTVTHFPCERIELRLEDEAAERRFLLDVDGDALGSLPLTVEVLPRRLPVRA
jgi:diacylglycerol kinase (ATP)